MRVAPNLGIGDLLILKMRVLTNNVEVDSLAIQRRIAHDYRVHEEEYLAFVQLFLSRLFPGVPVDVVDDESAVCLDALRIRKYRLYDIYRFEVPPSLPLQPPYVVVHTRARFDASGEAFQRDDYPLCVMKLKLLRSSYPIVLLGERAIEVNRETTLHPIYSLYSLFRNLPCVVDMTRNSTASNNTIAEFEREMHIVHGAKFNVVFGYGGPLSLSMAFGKQTLAYVGGIQHPVVKDYLCLEFLHRDIHSFLEVLQTKLL